MKRFSWEIKFGIFLIILSIIIYGIHYILFQNLEHIYLWSITSLAFLPISILFVTLIVNKLLIRRERSARMEKLNMLIGVYYSEVGTFLLENISNWDPNLDKFRNELLIDSEWTEENFLKLIKRLKIYDYNVEYKRVDLVSLRSFLIEKRDFLLRLLENPNLLEHESFTALLRAVFHLAEELEGRKKLKQISDKDNKHIAGDIKRVYGLLVHDWLNYMKYLQKNYPYLFSLALRTNPFDENASLELK
jgi:hypothetical protein